MPDASTLDNAPRPDDAPRPVPLTRRQARAIERRTGTRPVATAGAVAIEAFIPDAGHTPSAPIPVRQAGSSRSVRVAVPESLLRSRRRRAAAVGGAFTGAVAAAGTAVVLAAAGANPSGVAAADLRAGAAVPEDSPITATDQAPDTVPSFDVVASVSRSEAAAGVRGGTSVSRLDPAALEQVVAAPPTETASEAPTATAADAEPAGSLNEAVYRTALSWVGQGRYGHGTTPEAWDCSGFVLYVFKQHGIDLPWGADSQAARGVRVADPQPGDLVVWPGKHIGIYAGNHEMIDSSTWGHSIELDSIDNSSGPGYYYVRIQG